MPGTALQNYDVHGSSLAASSRPFASEANSESNSRRVAPLRIHRLTPSRDFPNSAASSLTLTPNRSTPIKPINSRVLTISGLRFLSLNRSRSTPRWPHAICSHSSAPYRGRHFAVLRPCSSMKASSFLRKHRCHTLHSRFVTNSILCGPVESAPDNEVMRSVAPIYESLKGRLFEHHVPFAQSSASSRRRRRRGWICA